MSILYSSRTTARLAAAGVAVITAIALTACGSSDSSPASGSDSSSGGGTFSSSDSAYDTIVNSGPVADDATVEANEWAKSVRDAGTLKVGGVETSVLFSKQDLTTGTDVGFDAGLTQLLARYILGDASKTAVTQVTSDTREDLLVNKQVDLVAATYSITPARQERISFAGPYYSSSAGILVKKGDTAITSVADLAGKTVATQSGSTGETTLATYAPDATVLSLPDNAQCVQAVQQGRADAYVIDQTLLLNNVTQNDDLEVVAGASLGTEDLYGIGLPKDSDGVEFVNAFLQKIEDDGTWLNLWKTTIQDKTGLESEPTPPEIGKTD